MKSEFSTKTLIYLRAAELVEQEGLCKHGVGEFGNGRGVCAIHALQTAGSQLGAHRPDAEIRASGWVAFTAHPDTTAAMVAAKLREQAFA